MEKINKFMGLGILLFATLLVLPMMSAATVMNTPAAASSNSGTFSFNCSTTTVDIKGALNASIYYNASGGAAGTYLTVIANDTNDDIEFVNSAIDVSGLTDAATYNFTCVVANDTDTDTSAGKVLTIDNTAPTNSFLIPLSSDSESYGQAIEYRCLGSDSIDASLTTVWSVAHPTGDTTTSTDLTASSSLARFTDTDYPGDYVFTCTSTDDAGNSDTDTATVTVGDLGRMISVKNDGAKDNMLLYLVGIALILYLVFRKK